MHLFGRRWFIGHLERDKKRPKGPQAVEQMSERGCETSGLLLLSLGSGSCAVETKACKLGLSSCLE